MKPRDLAAAIATAHPDAQGTFPELKICCPNCGDTRYRLGINVAMQVGHCFNCAWRLGPVKLKQLFGDHKVYEENSFDELDRVLQQTDTVEHHLEYEHVPVLDVPAMYIEDVVDTPNKTQALVDTLLLAVEYITRRGFDLEIAVANKFMIGLPESRLRYRLVLPVFEQGQLLYYQARSLLNQPPKYLNPAKSEGGCGKSSLIYNIDCTLRYRHVYLCEGIFSALSVGDDAMAIFGKELSDVQATKLLKSSVEEIHIVFDPDTQRESLAAAEKLYPRKRVRIVDMQHGDPNEVEQSLLMSCLDNAKKYDELCTL